MSLTSCYWLSDPKGVLWVILHACIQVPIRIPVWDEEILSRRLRCRVHDGPVIGIRIFNDLTHLFTLELGAHLLSAALANGADKSEQDATEGKEGASVEDDVERGLLNAEDLDDGR